MNSFLKKIGKNELIKGSLTLLILLNIGNFLHYLFQFSMARMLGPLDYGTLAVLTHILNIFSVPTLSIQTVVSKYTTKYSVKKQFGKIKGLFESLIKKTLSIALLLFIIFFLISIFLTKYLNISFWLLILSGTFLFVAFIYPVSMGVIQGLKKFNILGWNFIFLGLTKLIISVVLVMLGWKIYGALLGWVLGSFLAFFISLPFIRKILTSKKIKNKISLFSGDSLSILLGILILVVIYSSDVILAKIFFSGDVVGKYAVISMVGKIILFAGMAIGNAMFPISSENSASGKRTRGVFKRTMVIVFLLSAFAVLIYGLFPELVIRILFGSQYLDFTNILLYTGISFSFISFLNIFILYKISTDKFKLKHVLTLAVFLIAQIILLSFIHKTIQDFSIALMFSTIITFIGSIILIKK